MLFRLECNLQPPRVPTLLSKLTEQAQISSFVLRGNCRSNSTKALIDVKCAHVPQIHILAGRAKYNYLVLTDSVLHIFRSEALLIKTLINLP